MYGKEVAVGRKKRGDRPEPVRWITKGEAADL